MSGTPFFRQTSKTSAMAVIWGIAGAGDDPGRADGARADADLDGVDAEVDELLGRPGRADVAGDELLGRELLLEGPDGVEDPLGVAVGVVDDDDVALGGDQGPGPVEEVRADADRGADPEAAQAVLGRVGVLDALQDVLVGDEALEVVVLVDDEELLDLVLVEDLLGVLERRPDGDGDELAGHDLLDRQVQAALEADVAVGQDADELVRLVRDGQARDAVLLHDLEGPGDLVLGPERDGLDDHAALVALDLVDLLGLALDRQVAVDDADAALLGQGDGHARHGHGVHGRADDGDVERDVAAEPGRDRGLLGDDVRLGREDEDVVEGEGFPDLVVEHGASLVP